jgi:SAM-dependent methyltransferase
MNEPHGSIAGGRCRIALLICIVLGGAVACLYPGAEVPYVQTPTEVVTEMLRLAGVNGNDVVYDLGSGDGRLVITAARDFGARGVGIEIDPQLVAQSAESARRAGVGDRVRFRAGDLFETDLSEATVVTLYLSPELNLRLRPKLLSELRPGSRIVSHDFNMGDWPPSQTISVASRDRMSNVFLWVVPPKTARER